MLGKIFKGAASSAIGGLFGIGQQALSSKLQYKYAKKMAQNSPSWNVEGLRKANLNPILAANPAGGSPSAGMPTGTSLDVAGSVANLSSAKLKETQDDIAHNQALSSASKAIIDLRKQQWESKVYDYMESKLGKKVMIPMSAIKMAGVNLSGAKSAGAAMMFMNALEKAYKNEGRRMPTVITPRSSNRPRRRPDRKKIKDRLKWR